MLQLRSSIARVCDWELNYMQKQISESTTPNHHDLNPASVSFPLQIKPRCIFVPVTSLSSLYLCNVTVYFSVCIGYCVCVCLVVCAGMHVFYSSGLSVVNVSVCVLKQKCGACARVHACRELIPSVCVLKRSLY